MAMKAHYYCMRNCLGARKKNQTVREFFCAREKSQFVQENFFTVREFFCMREKNHIDGALNRSGL